MVQLWMTSPNFLLRAQFLKKSMGVTEDDPRAGLKNELKQLFAKLCGKLDALCNFYYTPKAVIPEMKVLHSILQRYSVVFMVQIFPSLGT